MATIVSGTFTTFDEARNAAGRLRALVGDPERVVEFYRSPDGHHVKPGEVSASDHEQHEAPGAGAGAAAGAGVGATIGLAAVTLAAAAAGPAAPLLGAALRAYTGSLPGALVGSEVGETLHPMPPHRRGGPVVAVTAPEPDAERAARDILTNAGARQIEIAEGSIVAGEWQDYDPDSVPNLVLHRT